MVPVYSSLLPRAARLAGAALVALAPLAARAQAPRPASPPAGPALHHWQPSIYLDNRNPFEDAAAVRVIGLNVGVMPPGRHFRFGLGAYTLRHSYADYYTYVGKGKNRHIADTFSPMLSLRYFTPNFAYTVFSRRWVEVSVPLDVGIGGSHYTVTDDAGRVVKDMRDVFIPVEAGVSVLLKPLRWVGVSGGIGYRRALGDFDFEDDFNGWYYSYRLVVFVGPIWHDLRQHRQHRQVAPPARPVPPPPTAPVTAPPPTTPPPGDDGDDGCGTAWR